jgi:hypothetical protein
MVAVMLCPYGRWQIAMIPRLLARNFRKKAVMMVRRLVTGNETLEY